MKPLALSELVRKGQPYMNRTQTLLERIRDQKLLQLADDSGYVKVQSVKITFKDNSESNYTVKDLQKDCIFSPRSSYGFLNWKRLC